jgi:hypothetical protein
MMKVESKQSKEKIFGNFSTKAILEFLGIGGILTAAILAPNAVQVFKFLLKDEKPISWRKFNQSVARQYISRLEKRELIKREIKADQTKISLTKKGRAELLKYDIDKIELKKQSERWDGKWRVIIFDISEQKKSARDALRAKFKNLGMFQLQRSVFIYPFDCKKEIDFIADFFEVGEDILYLEARVADVEEKLRIRFNL